MKILKYVVAIAIAAVTAVAVPTAAHAAPSWYSGSVAPGVVQSWTWNNVPDGVVYEIGLSPLFATAAAPCKFEIVKSWYVRQTSGEREFRFHIKNIGTISCGTQIMLREFAAVNGLWVLPALAPNATSEHWWNNVPNDQAYVPGLVPYSGTPGIPGACALEVTRRWDLTQASASGGIEREFHFVVKNVGTNQCGGAIILGAVPASSSFSGGIQAVGSTGTYGWNNANPIDKAYVVGVNPSFPSLYSTCGYEVTRRWYQQVANNGNSLERELWFQVKNVGTLQCGFTNLLA